MRLIRSTVGAVFGAVMLTTALAAERSYEPAIRDTLQQVTAKVEAVDHAKRILRLNGGAGPAEFEVSPEVRNFDQIKVGDEIKISYYSGVAAQIKKKGDAVTVPSDAVVAARAAPGAKPGAAVGRNITTSVNIQAVDTKTNTVTFKRPDGTVDAVVVEHPEGKAFIKTLKVGDQVDVTFTEAVAVEVVTTKK